MQKYILLESSAPELSGKNCPVRFLAHTASNEPIDIFRNRFVRIQLLTYLLNREVSMIIHFPLFIPTPW